MKKNLLLIMAILLVVTFGCQSKEAKYEATLEKYAKQYYNTYKDSLSKVDAYDIRIADLKAVNTQNGKDVYDLSSLSSCTDDSYIEFTVTNGNITKTSANMNCK